MIDNQSIEQLKNNIDIVNIISNYIDIKKSGANFKANCPFHGEKTASFMISPTKQIYHCFGCQVGGDAIKFVQEYEKLNYPEALEKIASMMNFTLQYTKGTHNSSKSRRVLEEVQNWYSKNLDSMPIAKRYLKERGINQNSIEKFGIGYVGNSSKLMNFLSSNLLSLIEAQEVGIIDKRESGGFYSRLTERITFPIYSATGGIVGFGGRTITNHPAKYINSPQTKLFNKSQLLYGYSKAKESIYKNKKIIICEGYLDVVMFHQAGFTEAVATLGTALTVEHLPILRKGEPHILLAYDGDKAGVNAGLKASILLTKNSFDGSIVLFPNGADPADMIAMGKSGEVATLFRNGQPMIPFVIEMLAKKYDLKNPIEKEKGFKEIKEYLDELSPIIRDSYIVHASTILGVREELFEGDKSEVKSYNKKEKSKKVELTIKSTKDDTGKLSIIKTLIDNRELIKEVLSVIEPTMFEEYESLFTLVIEKKESPILTELLLDDTVKILTKEELKKDLAYFLFKYYNNMFKSITSNDSLSIMKKSFLIRKIKIDILPKLKRGELVTYKF